MRDRRFNAVAYWALAIFFAVMALPSVYAAPDPSVLGWLMVAACAYWGYVDWAKS